MAGRLTPRVRTLAATLLLAASAAGEELPLTHFATEDQRVPLPSSSVQTIVQDDVGFIWLGFFSAGVARYDGQGLELFGMADGLLDVTVREVVQDGAGFLWIGSETGVVVSDRPLGSDVTAPRPRFRARVGGLELARTRIRHTWMTPAADGGVWVATAAKGLIHYRIEDDGTVSERSFPLADPGGDAPPGGASLAVRRDGTLWLGLENGRVGRLAPGAREVELLPAEASPPAQVTSLHEAPDGTLWAGCRNGALLRLDESGEPRFVPVSGILREQVSTILVTPEGDLWATSLGSGVLLIPAREPARPRRYDRRHGLLSETVWHVTRDHEGSLWFATNAGCSRLRPDYAAFSHVTGRSRAGEAPSLPDPSAFAVLPPAPGDPDLVTWVATGSGVAALAADGRRAAIGVAQGLPAAAVYTLARDPEGRIWIGTLGGLGVLADAAPLPAPLGPAEVRPLELLGRRYRLATYPLGTMYGCRVGPIPRTASLTQSAAGMWLSGTEGVTVWVEGRWYFLRAASGIPPAGAVATELDPTGRVWVVTKDSGVLRSPEPVTLERLERAVPPASVDRTVPEALLEPWWDRTTGAPTNAIHNLLWAGGRMWVATAAGLFALEEAPPRPIVALDAGAGLGGSHVMGMALDAAAGTMWVTQNAGIAEVDPVTGRVVRTVSKADGLIDNEAWGTDASIALSADGTVHVATPKGLTLYRPALDHDGGASPRVVMREAEVVDPHTGSNEVTVHWAALSYIDEAAIRYRTRLRGFSDRWSPATAETKLRYTNLPALFVPAAYTFEVSARSGAGAWTEPVAFRFRVRPAWWRTWWASLIAAALLALAVQASNRIRTERLRRRTLELEETVAARTFELRTYAAELETLDRIVVTVNREVDFDKVGVTLLDQGLVLLRRARTGVLLLAEPERGGFAVAASTGWPKGLVDTVRFSGEEALARFAAKEDQIGDGVSVVRDLESRPGADRVRHLPRGRTLLAVDLPLDGEIAGFLLFDLYTPYEQLRDTEVRALERYRQHAITALAKAHAVRELERAGRAAEQASRAKSAFLAAMSHELRTPLNAIIGFSEILLRKLRDAEDPRVPRFLTNILGSGQQLLALINDILDLSKIEAGRMVLELGQASVPGIVDGVCRIAQGMAARRGIEIVQEVDPALPPLQLDAGKVRQALENLVSNAVKFSPDDARVTVSARLLAAEESPLGRRTLEIAVADRGIGIPAEEHERIFEEFRQLDSGADRHYGGSGLGLALVRRYVGLMGGRVTVASEPGRGSTFTVALPADPAEAPPDAQTAAWPVVRPDPSD